MTTNLKCAHPCLGPFLHNPTQTVLSTLTQDMVYASRFPPYVGFQSLDERHHVSLHVFAHAAAVVLSTGQSRVVRQPY